MNIFGFKIPSFEDEFFRSDEEEAIENAPASTRRGGRMSPTLKQLTEEIRHNSRTMNGTIEAGLPRLINEVKALRRELTPHNREQAELLHNEIAELKRELAELKNKPDAHG